VYLIAHRRVRDRPYRLHQPIHETTPVRGRKCIPARVAELITLVVFCVFSVTYLGEPLRWNTFAGFGFIALGAAFIFKPW